IRVRASRDAVTSKARRGRSLDGREASPAREVLAGERPWGVDKLPRRPLEDHAPALARSPPQRRQRGASGQLAAFFTSLAILASAAGVSSFSAKDVAHNSPSSRFAVSLN